LIPGAWRCGPATHGLRVANEERDRVREEVLVAEELDEEVVRELRIAVGDDPSVPWRLARQHRRLERDVDADADRSAPIAALDERGHGDPRRARRRPSSSSGSPVFRKTMPAVS
jgi:hypothetical protein